MSHVESKTSDVVEKGETLAVRYSRGMQKEKRKRAPAKVGGLRLYGQMSHVLVSYHISSRTFSRSKILKQCKSIRKTNRKLQTNAKKQI
jgi:hypothetical protein